MPAFQSSHPSTERERIAYRKQENARWAEERRWSLIGAALGLVTAGAGVCLVYLAGVWMAYLGVFQ